MTERAVQSYDLIDMLCTALNSGVSDSSGLMSVLKSEEGYEGIYGKVMFDENGALIPSGNDVQVFLDGGFRKKS